MELASQDKISREQANEIYSLIDGGKYEANIRKFSKSIFASQNNPKIDSLIQNLTLEFFNKDSIRQTFIDNIQNNFKPRFYNPTIRWLNSPLANKIANLESNISTQDEKYDDISEQKKDLLKRFAGLARLSELLAQIPFTIDNEEIAEQSQNLYEIVSTGAIYQSLSDKELKQGIKFWESDAGSNLKETVQASITYTALHQSEMVLQLINKNFPSSDED